MIRMHVEFLGTPPSRGVRVSTVHCHGQLRPVEVEWPDGDNTVVVHTFDNLRRVPSTYALGREEALVLADALTRAARS